MSSALRARSPILTAGSVSRVARTPDRNRPATRSKSQERREAMAAAGKQAAPAVADAAQVEAEAAPTGSNPIPHPSLVTEAEAEETEPDANPVQQPQVDIEAIVAAAVRVALEAAGVKSAPRPHTQRKKDQH